MWKPQGNHVKFDMGSSENHREIMLNLTFKWKSQGSHVKLDINSGENHKEIMLTSIARKSC